MLKIIFGEVENSVYHPPTYFDNRYEDGWITDPLTDFSSVPDFEAVMLNTGTAVHSYGEYLEEAINIKER